VKNLINQFVKIFENNDEFQRRMDAYDRMLKTEEWQFLRDVLLTIKGTMLNDMFSHTFTNLDKEEKDITQKTYYNISQIFDFLLEPTKWIKRKQTFKNITIDLTRKMKSNEQGKGERK
jgi:hypothetical protein